MVEALISGIRESGLLLAADIDVQKNARKTGMEIGGNRILLVFRPDYAVRVWEAEIDAGVDIPVHIHIHETLEGRVQARYRPPSEIFAPYGNQALSEIGVELDPVFAGIMEGGR